MDSGNKFLVVSGEGLGGKVGAATDGRVVQESMVM